MITLSEVEYKVLEGTIKPGDEFQAPPVIPRFIEGDTYYKCLAIGKAGVVTFALMFDGIEVCQLAMFVENSVVVSSLLPESEDSDVVQTTVS